MPEALRNGNVDSRKKIAFVYYYAIASRMPSFVEQDFMILSRHFHCKKVNVRGISDFWRLLKLIASSDLCFSWFASGHSFLATVICKILSKKSAVVAGGFDVAYAPEICYGQYTSGWLRQKRSNFVLSQTDLILAVSDFTRCEAQSRASPRRIEVLYNAVDTDRFCPANRDARENAVVTVASGQGNVIKIKGLQAFVKAAALLPEVEFVILGIGEEDEKRIREIITSPNIEMKGYVNQDELIAYFQRSKVYCQLSYRESFGMATAEAMACGCVPVVTDRGALPEVVGDAGYYVPYGDAVLTARAIEKALSSGECKDARAQIESKFSLELREARMINLLRSLIE